MSQDIEKNIEQIKNLFKKDNSTEGLKNILELFNQSNNSNEKTDSNSKEANNKGFDIETLQMLLKVKEILANTSNKDDPREKLLLALKPYLNKKRQSSVDNCLNVLKITSIMNAIKKSEGSEDNAESR